MEYYYNYGTSFNYDTIPYYDIGSVAVIGEFTLETITTITNSFNDCFIFIWTCY